MNQNNPYFVYKEKEKNGKNIENIYVLYTPKIIKFVQESAQSQKRKTQAIQQRQKLTMTGLIANNTSNQPKYLDLTSSKKQNHAKTRKIKLVSRKTTEIQSQKNDKSLIEQNQSKIKSHIKLKLTRKLKTYSALENSNIKSGKIVKTAIPIAIMACSLFEGCRQTIDDRQSEYANQKLKNVSSRIIIIDQKPELNQRKRETCASQVMFEVKNINSANNQFKSRKRIFDIDYQSRILRSNKQCDFQSQKRSRSKRRIFQHYSVNNRSLSQDLSISKRKRIFQSKTNDKKHNQSINLTNEIIDLIEINEIPQILLTAWNKQQQKKSLFNFSQPIRMKKSNGL